MELGPGSNVGPYSIVREIGRGGMGIVYLARDPRLGRDVAIKTLPEHLADDPERLVRFETEARTLAQLNHPGVAGILGVEEIDGRRLLILEYVEGESLGERLDRGALPVDDALKLAVKIASGLEAAHEAGVIHRDLKPDNIKITPDGDVKVLDFGLAKIDETGKSTTSAPSDPTLTSTPTATRHMPTMPGAILGTAAYMSPEQARGRRLDKRSDIWSFGVVLYECLTGVSPFAGDTVSDSIGAVLHRDPDLDRLPDGTPPAVRRVLGRCLERDKTRRYRDIGDVRIELADAANGDETTEAAPATRLFSGPALALALALGLIGGAAAWLLKPSGETLPLPVLHAEFQLPDGDRVAHGFYPGLALSPDGRTLAFFTGKPAPEDPRRVRARQLVLRRLGEPNVTPIPGAEANGAEPVFSPDGGSIAYVTTEGLYSIPLTGGLPAKLATVSGTVGLAWSEDGTIVMGNSRSGLTRLPASGGTPQTLTELDTDADELSHRLPHALPGGERLLFTVLRFDFRGGWDVWGLDLSSGERRLLVESASDARYADGRLFFVREGALWAVPFDHGSLRLTGEPRLVLEGVLHAIHTTNVGRETGAGLFAVSAQGTLAYLAGSVYPEQRTPLVMVDRDGNETPLDIEPRLYHNLRSSPDGRYLAMSVLYVPTSAVWLHDFERGLTQRQRSDGIGRFVSWGPGPDRITYDRRPADGRSSLYHKPIGADSSEEVRIALPEEHSLWLGDWSRDGETLLAVEISPDNRFELWAYGEEGGWRQITDTPDVTESWPLLSPDGKWLAYVSTESGESRQLMVRPFPSMGAAVQVSRNGAASPLWSHDGSRLFFRGRDDDDERAVMMATVSTSGDRIDFGRPRRLFDDAAYSGAGPIRTWDVLPGDRFVLGKRPSEQTRIEVRDRLFPNRVRVVQGWLSTLD